LCVFSTTSARVRGKWSSAGYTAARSSSALNAPSAPICTSERPPSAAAAPDS
jgi:hypothetical protein